MEVPGWIILAITCTLLRKTSSTPQQIITAVDVNDTSFTFDPFLDMEEFGKDYASVCSLKFHLKDETLLEFFTRVALVDISSECNVTVTDIIEAIQLARYTTEDIAEAIGKVKIEWYDFYNMFLLYDVNATVIENLLQTFGLTFSEIYNNFVKTLLNPSQIIPDVLKVLNISLYDFTNAQAFGNDSDRIRVLCTGNYTKDNINAVLNITGKIELDLLKMLPLNSIARQIRNVNEYDLVNFLKNLGVENNNLQEFYGYLNVTHISLLTHPVFITCVTDTYNHLNSEEVLGVAISESNILTSNKAKALASFKNQNNIPFGNYIRFYAELVENPLVQHPVKSVRISNPEYQTKEIAVVETLTPFPSNVSEIVKTYNTSLILNCTYVSKQYFGGVYSENVPRVRLTNNTITMNKTAETEYNLGSPIFCQDKLYGIAIQDGVKDIKFMTFHRTDSGTTAKPQIPEGGSTSSTQKPGEGSSAIPSYSILHFVTILAIVMIL